MKSKLENIRSNLLFSFQIVTPVTQADLNYRGSVKSVRTGSLLPAVNLAALPAEATRTRTGWPEVSPETRVVSTHHCVGMFSVTKKNKALADLSMCPHAPPSSIQILSISFHVLTDTNENITFPQLCFWTVGMKSKLINIRSNLLFSFQIVTPVTQADLNYRGSVKSVRTGSLLPAVSSAALPAEATQTLMERLEVSPETRVVSTCRCMGIFSVTLSQPERKMVPMTQKLYIRSFRTILLTNIIKNH